MSQDADINAESSDGEILHCQESPGDASEVENLKNCIGELEQSLTLTKAKLVDTESRLKQQIEQREAPIDLLENEDVRKLIKDYKTEMKALEEKLKCVSSNETATRIAEENQKLKKRNRVLLSTNTDFVAKYSALSAQLEETEKERDKLKADIELAQSTRRTGPSQCHPGGDIGVVTETLPPKEQVVEKSCLGKDQTSVADLQKYLREYYTLLHKSRCENSVLLQQLEYKQRLVSDIQAQMKKLSEQMVVVVQERDENQTALEKMRKRMGQSEHGANNVPLETEFSSKLNLQAVYTEQHKHLLVELTEKLKYKEDHIQEQEAKIEKLIIRCCNAEKDRDAYAQEYNPISNPQMGLEVDRLHKIISEREAELEEMRHICEEYQKKHSELTNELEQLKSNENPDTFFYNEQLKAFQEDYIAEREEKKRILNESRRLHEDNAHLILELQTRSSPQGHFSSPPLGPRPSFDPLHPQSPPVSLNHQPPEYPMPGQNLQTNPPPQGTLPNTGVPIYQASYSPEYRTNTIPPRSHAGPHGQYQYNYHPEQQFYAQRMPNYEIAREVNPEYQSMYRGPSSSVQRPRAPNAGSPQERPLQDRHVPR